METMIKEALEGLKGLIDLNRKSITLLNERLDLMNEHLETQSEINKSMVVLMAVKDQQIEKLEKEIEELKKGD